MCYVYFLWKLCFTLRGLFIGFPSTTLHIHMPSFYNMKCYISLSSSAADYVPSKRAHVYIIYRPLSNHLRRSLSRDLSSIIHPDCFLYHFRHMTHYTLFDIKYLRLSLRGDRSCTKCCIIGRLFSNNQSSCDFD